MRNMSETNIEKRSVKEKVAKSIKSMLVHQAENGTKGCVNFPLYEPTYPKEIIANK